MLNGRECRHVMKIPAAILLALLSACGGGEESNSTPTGIVNSKAQAFAVTVAGNGVYVDSAAGKDTNPGTQSAPFKTLTMLATVQLAAGQSIYLNCSGTWRETLSLTSANLVDGTSITGYGSSCATAKPRILGSNDLSTKWVKSGNIWSKSVGTTLPKISRLFINGQMLRIGQWPNASVNGGVSVTDPSAPLSSTQTTISAFDASSLAGRNLVGATLLMRTQPWYIDSGVVTAYSAVTRALTVNGTLTYPMGPTDNYTLQDQQWMVDEPGEFYHDTVTGTVYVYPLDTATQTNLNTAKVEASVRDNAIEISGRRGIKLTNLSAEMARENGVYLLDTPDAVLTGMNVVNNTNRGIHADQTVAPTLQTRSISVSNSNVAGSALAGVDAWHVSQALVANSTITNIGTIANAGNSFAGVLVGPQSIVDANTIRSTAYNGVRYSGTGGSVVSNNAISTFCVRLDDCAGIYTWNGTNATRALLNQASTITGNVLDGNSVGATAAYGSPGGLIAGIYLDDFTAGAAVQSNVISRTPIGIIVHNGTANSVVGNKLWLNTSAGLWMNMDQADADYMVGNTISNNEIAPLAVGITWWPMSPKFKTAQAIWYFNSYLGDTALTTRSNGFSGNQVVLLTEQSGREVRVSTAGGDRYLSGAAWTALNPADLLFSTGSMVSPITLTLGTELALGGGFDAGLGFWTKWINPVATGGYVNPVKSGLGCLGACVEFLNSAPGDILTSPGMNFTAGAKYYISFDATFPAGGEIGLPYIARKVAPYDSFVVPGSYNPMVGSVVAAGRTTSYRATFDASSPDLAVVNLKLGSIGAPANIDNVSVRPILGFGNKVAGDVAVAITAPRTASRTVNCSDVYLPAGCTVKAFNGVAQTLPVVLVPGESRLFIKP